MITAKHHEHLLETIKGFSELELDAFMEDLSEHVSKNKMQHLIDKHAEPSDDAVAELIDAELENQDLERKNRKLELQLKDEREKIETIKKLLQ
jgi:predicted  nucleic acid-binding Zn-ribbon protein